MAKSLKISPKHSVEICSAIRGMEVEKAKTYLKDVIAMKKSIPFKRHNKKVGHRKGQEGWPSGRYPVKAADWILENLDINNIKLFNEYNYGSYLIFKGIPVFIDSRADLYAPEFNGRTDDIFMEFINTSGIGKFYGNTFKSYGITHIIVYKNSKIAMLIENADRENYNKIYSDDSFVIYEIIK